MEEALTVVREFGAPMVLLLWFMFRAEKRMESMQKTLIELVTIAKRG